MPAPTETPERQHTIDFSKLNLSRPVSIVLALAAITAVASLGLKKQPRTPETPPTTPSAARTKEQPRSSSPVSDLIEQINGFAAVFGIKQEPSTVSDLYDDRASSSKIRAAFEREDLTPGEKGYYLFSLGSNFKAAADGTLSDEATQAIGESVRLAGVSGVSVTPTNEEDKKLLTKLGFKKTEHQAFLIDFLPTVINGKGDLRKKFILLESFYNSQNTNSKLENENLARFLGTLIDINPYPSLWDLKTSSQDQKRQMKDFRALLAERMKSYKAEISKLFGANSKSIPYTDLMRSDLKRTFTKLDYYKERLNLPNDELEILKNELFK